MTTTFLDGTCQILALDMGRNIHALPRYVAVAVTTYHDAPDYFEVHSVTGAEEWLMANIEDFDGAMKLYRAVARALDLKPGWRAKAPSGSTWAQAMLANRQMHGVKRDLPDN